MKRWYLRRQIAFTMGLMLVAIAPAGAAALSQGYKSAQPIATGALVGLDQSNSSVSLANASRLDELLGVVVAANSTLVAVSSEASQVQVVTSGTAIALVSNLNGDIKKGDPITASPIDGVGMKATLSGRTLGLAQADFSATTPGSTTETIKTKSGQRQVVVGGVSTLIGVGFYAPKPTKSLIPSGVQNGINTIAGKEVSTIHIIVATGLFVLGLALAAIILSSSVRSSLQSIGRNPLARSAINRGLFKVLLLVLAILLVTLGSVYLVIKG